MTGPTSDFDVLVYFDGACSLCSREISMLRRLDRKNRIRFEDIAAADFDPSTTGLSYAQLMERIHGRLADGTPIEGVEVFRRLYTAVGFGPLVWLTRLPIISHLLTAAYTLFAKNRLRLTGRCADDVCAIPPHATGARES